MHQKIGVFWCILLIFCNRESVGCIQKKLKNTTKKRKILGARRRKDLPLDA